MQNLKNKSLLKMKMTKALQKEVFIIINLFGNEGQNIHITLYKNIQ